jgi:hypothetical protein
MSNKKTTVLIFEGGAGDIIAQTSVLRAFRNKYPNDEILVYSTYSWVFDNNPNCDEHNTLDKLGRDFYSSVILEKNIRFLKKRFMYNFMFDRQMNGCKNLLEFACSCYDIEYDGKGVDYFISDYEKRAMHTFMHQNNKKKVILHIMGATPSDGNAYQKIMCAACRGSGIGRDGSKCEICGGGGAVIYKNQTNALKDLNPAIIAPIIERHNKEIDFLQFGLEGEPVAPGAIDCLGMPIRDAIACFPYCDSFIVIESLFGHASAAVNKSGIVVFQNMDPKFFGYAINHAIWDSGGLSSEKLEEVLMESLGANEKPKSFKTLEAARSALPPPPNPPEEPPLELIKEGAIKRKPRVVRKKKSKKLGETIEISKKEMHKTPEEILKNPPKVPKFKK